MKLLLVSENKSSYCSQLISGELKFSGSTLQKPVELTVDGEEKVALPITWEKDLKDLIIEAEEAIGECKLLVE